MMRPDSPDWPTWSNRKSPLLDRFCSKVRVDADGCWLWTGAHAASGYPQIGNDRKVHYAHRIAYELFVGPIPEGLHIDHLCGVRSCVNPEHLEAVTQAENNRRAWIVRRRNQEAAA